MKTTWLLAALLLCVHCEADDTDMLQKLRTQLEGQQAALTEQITMLQSAYTNLTLEMSKLKTDLTLEITQLKTEVNNLKDRCPSGWTKFGESCYYTSTEKRTWQQSREYCQSQAADLVVIDSREEQDFVVAHVGKDKFVWIGLNDLETEGVWKWVDGKRLTSPSYWGTGEPNSHEGNQEDCVVFYNGDYYAGWRMGDDGGWNDTQCTLRNNWMCEMPVGL